jgi:ABC-2 type transport system permease protein
LLRDKKLIITGFIFLLLVSLSIVGGYRHYHQITRDRQESQNLVRKSWLNQREKNPHSAAHYGTFAYRPMSVLSFFDLGIDTYAGNSIYLEAHRQNEPRFSVASESSSIIRFGELTVAFILQVILPLFIFFIGFNIISKEREDNTLKIIFSQGIDMKRLAWAKLIALLGLICMLLIPIFIGILILGYKTLSEPDGFLFPSRVSILFLTYFLYVFILCAITVCISAMMKNSRNALLLLLGVWIFSCIILPKVSANIRYEVFYRCRPPLNFQWQ